MTVACSSSISLFVTLSNQPNGDDSFMPVKRKFICHSVIPLCSGHAFQTQLLSLFVFLCIEVLSRKFIALNVIAIFTTVEFIFFLIAKYCRVKDTAGTTVVLHSHFVLTSIRPFQT